MALTTYYPSKGGFDYGFNTGTLVLANPVRDYADENTWWGEYAEWGRMEIRKKGVSAALYSLPFPLIDAYDDSYATTQMNFSPPQIDVSPTETLEVWFMWEDDRASSVHFALPQGVGIRSNPNNRVSMSYSNGSWNDGWYEGYVWGSTTREFITLDTGPSVTVPGAPTNVSASPGRSQATLSWSAPTSDGGSPILYYEVSSDGASWTNVGGASSYTFTGLTDGARYTLSVRAVNSAGRGAAASATVTPVNVPGVPENVTALHGNKSATLTWEPPGTDGGSAITGYQVTQDGGNTWSDAELEGSYTFEDLENGVEYLVGVRAVNAIGAGGASIVAVTPEPPPAPPGAPTNLRAVPGDAQVLIEWNAPLDSGTAPITSYEVSQDSGDTWVSIGLVGSHTFVDLVNGTTYTLGVRAVNAVGAGTEAFIDATPLSPEPPSPSTPRGIFAGRLAAGAVKGTFTPIDRRGALGTIPGEPTPVNVIIDEGGAEQWQKVEAEHSSNVLIYGEWDSVLADRACVGGHIAIAETGRVFRVDGFDVVKNQRLGLIMNSELTCSEQLGADA